MILVTPRAMLLWSSKTKSKRAGTGLRAIDHERASPGFTLFAVYQSETTTMYLIDLDGAVVHT